MPRASQQYDDDDDNVHFIDDDDDDMKDEPLGDTYDDPLPEEQPRHKYSTADMKSESNLKRYCLICLMFLLMLAFMIALSMLMQHFFFSGVSDNGPIEPEIDPNATFNEEKSTINAACSRGTYLNDGGLRCKEACLPQYFECCDPFGEFDDLKNITRNITLGETGDGAWGGAATEKDLSDCTLDTELRGCVSYSRCQAIGEYEMQKVTGRTVNIQAAPSTLSVHCSFEILEDDPVACEDLCQDVTCCWSKGSDNCMAESFDICMDYAPCQNLRPERPNILETAPDNLDTQCLWQQPSCTDDCKKAECCGDPESTCLQTNFIACMTYAACTDVTRTHIELPPQYNQLPKPSKELVSACGEHNELSKMYGKEAAQQHPAHSTCSDLCSAAQCCWERGAKNCFFEDPLGCLAFEQECQTLFIDGRRGL